MFDFFKRGKDNKVPKTLESETVKENKERVDIEWDNLGFTNKDNNHVNSDNIQAMPNQQLFDLGNGNRSNGNYSRDFMGKGRTDLGRGILGQMLEQEKNAGSDSNGGNTAYREIAYEARSIVEKTRREIDAAKAEALMKRIEETRRLFTEKYKEYVSPEVNEKLNFVSDISPKTVSTEYKKPLITSLNKYKLPTAKEIKDISNRLLEYLKANGIGAIVESFEQVGNVYTFGLKLEAGVRVGSLTKEKDAISVALGGPVEFEIPLRGTSLFGIHLLLENETVCLRQCLESKAFIECQARMPLMIGVSDHGEMVVDDLDTLGHLLIGGTSGSGKSVLINSLLLGLLYKTDPKDVRFILIDTSILNLSVYNGIPQLDIPVVTESRKALWALDWCCSEIKNRNRKMTDARLKDIDDYNAQFPDDMIPHIVVIIDEFGPVIDEEGALEAFKEIFTLGKPAGIHMILTTQKITSKNVAYIFKNSVNARISLNVFSEAESKSFLGVSGAEKLRGPGNMLYRRPGTPDLVHIYGIDTKDEEAISTVKNIREFNSNYAVESGDTRDSISIKLNGTKYDPYLFDAGLTIINNDKASIGMIQRTFKLGFNRSARIMDQLCDLGVVGDEEGTKPRSVLMTKEQFCSAISEIL